MFDQDAYLDTPQGHNVPPSNIPGTGDGLGGNGSMLGDNLATVNFATGPLSPEVCQKCATVWIILTVILVVLVLTKDRILEYI